MSREEVAVVLDFLPNGYPFDNRPHHRKTPIVQAIGKTRFALPELVPKKDINIQPGIEVYIGEGKRDHIHHIVGKLVPNKLTATAKSELEFIVKDVVEKNEEMFIDFFNKAQPLTTRMHQLELLPGLGKKHMWAILEKRDEKLFTDFKDLKERVKLIPDPQKVVVKRITNEILGLEKYRIFAD